MMCMNVDLPEPEGPVTARNSPVWTSKLTPRSARTSTSPTTYVLTRLLTEMTTDMRLPAAGRGPTAEAARAAAALVLLERIAGALCVSRRPDGADARDRGDDLRARLQRVSAQELGERAVRDSEPNVHGLQLLVLIQPHATLALDGRQGSEECV